MSVVLNSMSSTDDALGTRLHDLVTRLYSRELTERRRANFEETYRNSCAGCPE